MRILVTSDNHLGFKETDPIRSEDSFNTFDEILSIATREKVDLVLQGGDLFHENKPSRNTYNKTIRILKNYCLGTTKPSFKTSILMNTDDINMNISLPILSIHGNHDDPSGFNSISPLDILHGGGFINYFGKIQDIEDIELKPILIEGNKKLAIYGMGHIKDRRVYRTFAKKQVKYQRPEGDDWISILMVHQNRAVRENEYLPEDFIDPFFDLVIYGHEHESLRICHRNFDVIQSGSTVRTSLCEAEAGEKFVYLLDFPDNKPISISKIKLQSVRPFVMDTLKITNGDPEQQIRRRVEEVIEKLKEENSNNLLPLLRLRIDIDGKLDFNKHRVLSQLEARIANPGESLRITRKTQKELQKQPSIVAKTGIEDIYRGILESATMKTLVQRKVIESLLDFVDKDCKDAFTNMIKDTVKSILENVNTDDLVTDSIDDAIANAKERLEKECGITSRSCSDEYPPMTNSMDHISVIAQCPETEIIPSSASGIFQSFSDPKISMCATYSDPISVNTSDLFRTLKNDSSNNDFTFIEDKLETQANKKVIENVKNEMQEGVKKPKIVDSDDLLDFTKFI